jgi:hypothetical protein
MTSQIKWNVSTPYEHVKEDLELRGYKLVDPNLQTINIRRFINPGSAKKIVLLHYDENSDKIGNIETQFSIWLPEDEHERFLCSRYVDLSRSNCVKINMYTQTEPIDIPSYEFDSQLKLFEY